MGICLMHDGVFIDSISMLCYNCYGQMCVTLPE